LIAVPGSAGGCVFFARAKQSNDFKVIQKQLELVKIREYYGWLVRQSSHKIWSDGICKNIKIDFIEDFTQIKQDIIRQINIEKEKIW
jgi:hypothetical protein